MEEEKATGSTIYGRYRRNTESDLEEEVTYSEVAEMTVEVIKPDYTNQLNFVIIILGIIAGMIWVKNLWS